MAGHSDAIRREYYELDAQETTVKAINALQEERDTVTPLEELDLSDNRIGEDRRQRLEDVKEAKAKKATMKNEAKAESSLPVDKLTLMDVVRCGLGCDSTWLEKKKCLSPFKWKQMFLRMACRVSKMGKYLRKAVIEALKDRKLLSVVVEKCLNKMKKKRILVDDNFDCLIHLLSWMSDNVDKLSSLAKK